MLHGQQFSFLKIQPPPYLITYLSEKAIQMHWWKPVSVYFFISEMHSLHISFKSWDFLQSNIYMTNSTCSKTHMISFVSHGLQLFQMHEFKCIYCIVLSN